LNFSLKSCLSGQADFRDAEFSAWGRARHPRWGFSYEIRKFREFSAAEHHRADAKRAVALSPAAVSFWLDGPLRVAPPIRTINDFMDHLSFSSLSLNYRN
jgi:hypothetical protein